MGCTTSAPPRPAPPPGPAAPTATSPAAELAFQHPPQKVLLVIASAREERKSTSRQLASLFAENARAAGAEVTVRDVNGLPVVNDAMAESFFVKGERTAEQEAVLAVSDELVAELLAHDTIVIAAPVYNFSLPAALKAYVDLITRVGVTFKYSEDGTAVGLVEGKQALAIITSGKMPLDSPKDFMTPYMTFMGSFLGIHSMQVIDASRGATTDPRDAITGLFAHALDPRAAEPTMPKPPQPAPVYEGPVLRRAAAKTLIVTASARSEEKSTSRQMAARFAAEARAAGGEVTMRDVNDLPYVNDAMVDSYFAQGERTDEQKAAVEKSDELVAELMAHDTIVIATPMYNFLVPAALKAYVDLVTRAGLTFNYLENGTSIGLVEGKQVFVLVASGPAVIGSASDFLTPYLAFVMGFMGMSDVQVVNGSKGAPVDPMEVIDRAFAAI